MDEICGYIERITFQNQENGYTVAKIQLPKLKDLVCVVGSMPSVQPGETVRCQGTWTNHLVHGKQFIVESYRTEAPATVEGIKKYLGSGLVKGIGPVNAARVVETFGVDTLNVIDENPDALIAVSGIGKKRIDMIKKCWNEQKTIRDLMLYLQSHSISPTHAQRIFKTYGDFSIAIIKENPYRLAKEIFGIGFKTADGMAEKIGIDKQSTQRIDAGIEFALSELSNDGHVCYPESDFIDYAQKLLEVDAAMIAERIPILVTEDRLRTADKHIDDTKERFVWLKALYMAERGITKELWRLKKASSHLREINTEKALTWVQEKLQIELAEKQEKAVSKALKDKVQIITGGPGTGKSTITNAILRILEKLTQRIVLAAPTGRAAKRMTEITGRHAKTIHSLLEYDFNIRGFKRNRENPLECDLIIIDEASMIDTLLMNSLLKALPDTARLIFVGDINQLPSVGPGNVLKDMIASRVVATTRLTDIYRQAAGSKIITNAHRVNNGVFPDLENDARSDFFFIEVQEGEEALEEVVSLVSSRLPKKYGYDPITDIQVLAPMKKGVIGIENLNVLLQKKLNKEVDGVMRMGRMLKVGDKVMQIRNNYQKEVYNGDIGKIESIDKVNQLMTVSIDGNIVEYDYAEIDELVLAYAASIHKFQGSECRCVVIPVHTTHFIMLKRNLLYTGMTRGKELVVIVGSKRALAIAVKNDDVAQRHTALKEMITGGVRE